jgi:hypothetical protein
MRRLLAVPFERTVTREEVPSVVAERSLQQVRLHDVTVPHEVLPNPETIAEQNRHLITSMSPRAHSASRNHEQRSDATPFPYLTPLDILLVRRMVLRSCYRLLPLETRPQQGSMVHPMRIRGHEHLRFVSHCRECITVNCSSDLGHRPPSPQSARKVRRAPLRWTSAGTNISESDCVTPFARR